VASKGVDLAAKIVYYKDKEKTAKACRGMRPGGRFADIKQEDAP